MGDRRDSRGDSSRYRDRSNSRGRSDNVRKRDRSPERDRSRERERDDDRKAEQEVLSALKNVTPIDSKTREAIFSFAKKIDEEVTYGGRETKELFVGNLVDESITMSTLRLLINTAMRKLGLVSGSEEPVLICRMSNKFCGFIEFRSMNDASKAINMTGIPFRGNPLKINRPAKFIGPNNSIFTWQDLVPIRKAAPYAGTVTAATSSAPHPGTKPYREIFVGNTNSDMTETSLREVIGGAMMKMGLSYSRNENPVYQVRLTGKFAFLETRTAVDAANLLNFNGLPFCGSNLNIVRPVKYDGGCGIEAYFQWEALYEMWLGGDLRLMTAGPPTRILAVSNITTAEALQADGNLYLEIIEDTRLECSQFGVVRSVIVPRTTAAGSNEAVGKVFIEMDTVDQAINTLLALKVNKHLLDCCICMRCTFCSGRLSNYYFYFL